jgi:GntR family transcriptional regulator, transcriptional repressor for pyruvate dehydrogenase complex
MNNLFVPIKQSRVSEEVTEQIKSSVVRGQFKPGDKLPSERELSEQFHVSRAVIREALWILAKTGFIVIRPGASGGAFVTDMSFTNLKSVFVDLFLSEKISLHELTQARLLFEPEMARLAAKNITPEYAEQLKKALEVESIPSTSIEEGKERIQRVHVILAEICGNRFYEGLVLAAAEAVKSIVVFLQLDYSHPEGAHQAIVDAVIAGDTETAMQAMTEHSHMLDDMFTQLEADYRAARRQTDEDVP